jgi:predicted phage baseplate assembly protein
MTETLACQDDHRRDEVRSAGLNGVDGVEAHDDGLTLVVTFLGKAPAQLDPGNVRIDGGRRITAIRAIDVTIEREDDPDLDDRAFVTVDRTGDLSTYRLSVVEPDAYGRPGQTPLAGFDPRYAGADFDFHPNCPSDQDCAADHRCPPSAPDTAVIDYTTRDYASLRRQLLDRMTLTAPNWAERHVPDLGITAVEVLAYVGDQLEYQLDAVATEAYIDTARKRVSVRRHARLVDYAMHDGCNARALVAATVDEDIDLPAGKFRFLALDLGLVDPRERPRPGPVLSDQDVRNLPAAARYEVFEPVQPTGWRLRHAHNTIQLYTWQERECCIATGATTATLIDQWVGPDGADRQRLLSLQPGDIVIFEEVVGPRTGAQADADPHHRQAVRLVSVTPAVDALNNQPVIDIVWSAEDALTFPVCVSAIGGPDCALIDDITVVRANVLLVDHGQSLTFCGGAPENLDVPPDTLPPFTCAGGEGCPDRPDRGPAGDLIAALLADTRRGQQLTDDQLDQLRTLVGQTSLDRAQLDTEAPAADQAAQLEALLAQLTYPATPTRFNPVLSKHPVTQHVAYPDPALVSAGQAAVLGAVSARARAEVDAMWRSTKAGDQLTDEQITELTTLFGQAALDAAGLLTSASDALRDLLLQFNYLLDAKIRRIARLAARARAGEVLGDWLTTELRQTWGARYTDGLAADDPRLSGPAAAALAQDPRKALPAVELNGGWSVCRDLLTAGPRERVFTGETDEDAIMSLRFGDGLHGARPTGGQTLTASYRIGNGQAGNVGAEGIGRIVTCGVDASGVTAIRNPLPAYGGTDPEPMDDVRRLAPLALHRQRLRAITAADYAERAGQIPGVQRAAADIRWTGAGSEVHVAVDAAGSDAPADALLETVEQALQPYRRIGHDLVVEPAYLVPIDLELMVCAASGFQRGHVKDAVRRAVHVLFDPDAVSFGDPVRVSRIVAATAAVAGVGSVTITKLQRLFGQDEGELDAGVLTIGPLEVAELADDANLPENGRLRINIGGGQ